MSTLQEMLEAAKLESEKNAQTEINDWALANGVAANELRKLWNKHLVLGHKGARPHALG